VRSIFVVGAKPPMETLPTTDSLTKPFPAVASEWTPSEISRHRLSIGVRQLNAMGRQNDSSFGIPPSEQRAWLRATFSAEHGLCGFEFFLRFPPSPFDPKPAPHGLKVIPRRQRRA
jgi:hypothetical protein